MGNHSFEITNVGAVKHAKLEIPLGSIALIAGRNGQGKSTIRRVAAGLLTGTAMPCGRAGTHGGTYVRDGEEEAVADYLSPDGQKGARITWKHKSAEWQGQFDAIGQIGTGLVRFMDLDAKKRAAILINELQAAPTENDFIDALTAHMPEERAKTISNKLWKEICALGFDSVGKLQNAEGIVLKRKWQELTGKSRWSESGLDWVPAHWNEADWDITVEDLLEQVTVANDALENAIRSEAIIQHDMVKLRDLANKLPARQQDAKTAHEETNKADQNLSHERKKLSDMQKSHHTDCLTCPSCETKLLMSTNGLVPYTMPSDDEIAAANKELTEQNALVQRLHRELLDELAKKYTDARALVKESENAATTLKNVENMQAQLVSTGLDVNGCRLKLETAQQRHKRVQSKIDADNLHEQIMENQFVQDVLKPEGLRRMKLDAKLTAFKTEYLDVLCKLARTIDPNWDDVNIDNAMGTWFGQRSTEALVSDGELTRVACTIQMALAMVEAKRTGRTDQILILDRVEDLDDDAKSALLKMLHGCRISAILCVTEIDPKKLPNLSKLKIGQTYFINNGELHSLRVDGQLTINGGVLA